MDDGLRVVIEPARSMMTAPAQSRLADDLIGWRDGDMLMGEWLDGSGPLDAPEKLPAGGMRNRLMTVGSEPVCRLRLASCLRDGVYS